MDFENVLSIASQNQGLSNVPATKRYSLQAGPAKRHPKVKGVESAAVQAFLRRKNMEQKQKEMESKRRKEELLARRVELKSDRKARAMASRTKDNFKGYNGIPVVDQVKKRQSKGLAVEESTGDFDEDNYEYSQTDSDAEPEPTKSYYEGSDKPLKKMPSKKPSVPAKAAPPPMNFSDLLKLAQKKQFEPVELKPKKKTEERLRTAEELRELEMERKAKRPDKGKESKAEKEPKLQANLSASKKSFPDKEVRNGKTLKSSSEKLRCSGPGKQPKPPGSHERVHSTAKVSQGDKHASSSSSSSGALSGKTAAKSSSQASSKLSGPRLSYGPKPVSASDLTQKRRNPPLPPGKSGSSASRLGTTPNPAPSWVAVTSQSRLGSSGAVRPSVGSASSGLVRQNLSGGSNKVVRPTLGSSGETLSTRPRKGEPARSGVTVRPGNNGQLRPVSGGPLQMRPGGSSLARPAIGGNHPAPNGPGRPGSGVGRPVTAMCSAPTKPKCTVVAETISSKNVAPRPGMAPRLPPGHRPMMRPPGTMLPPITSSYKRKYDDEEYDPEMEDFIDDGGEDQDEISKHIREIFGYDRTKYQEESDYALQFMESSWRDQQKEEARSLRLGIKEDEEDMRMEEEERKKKLAMSAKRKRM
ncbi:protein SPT2 homolog isoform X2 [Scleropages formosus]|uniref:Protein SPT2 homolog n=1 Tax=Scleropages formosus TaxID=113540 RepID=A0A8C9R336_SCLFO|nr:protein SPT2 homolog isoform X2 [Scleropages formosus]